MLSLMSRIELQKDTEQERMTSRQSLALRWLYASITSLDSGSEPDKVHKAEKIMVDVAVAFAGVLKTVVTLCEAECRSSCCWL